MGMLVGLDAGREGLLEEGILVGERDTGMMVRLLYYIPLYYYYTMLYIMVDCLKTSPFCVSRRPRLR